MGFSPRMPAPQLQAGAFGHELLAAYYSHGLPIEQCEVSQGIIQRYLGNINSDNEETNRLLRILGMMVAYPDLPPLPFVEGSVERKVEHEVSLNKDGITVRGIVDLYLSLPAPNPAEVIVEHKFTSNPDYYELFSITPQVGIYLFMLPATHVLMNLLTVPVLHRKAMGRWEYVNHIARTIQKNPGKFLHRTVYAAGEFNTEVIWGAYKVVVGDILNKLNSKNIRDQFYQTAHDCNKCPYYTVCRVGTDPSQIPDMYYRRGIDTE